jgi:glycosyltransferase involved in cell wall biosynthesis
MIKKGSLADRIWSKWNHKLLSRASTIYSLSDNMAALIRQYSPGVKVEVIHNWTDTAHIKPMSKDLNLFAKEYDQQNKITVMYSGNMGATHAVERIADIAAALKNDGSFGFMLIGDGAKKALIEQMKTDQGIHNLIILPYQSADTLPYSLTTADIAIVTLSAGAEDLSVPSKTYNMLAAGAALLVIASPTSELANLVKAYNCGEQFEEHEIDRMIAFVSSLKENPGKLRVLKENARKASYDFTPANAELYPKLLNSNAHVS